MIKRDKLIEFILETIDEETLTKARALDELANGVQFHGAAEVDVVTLGVSLNTKFLEQAAELNSNFAIFHHALDPRVHKGLYPTYTQQRLQKIIKHNFTVLGFHGALDMHPTLGNNAQIIQKLDAKITDSLYENWGFTATFPKPIHRDKVLELCQNIINPDPLVFFSGPEKIKTIGVCSGAAKPYASHIQEMLIKKVDLYISGETSESVPYKMLESGINYLVCGHYATEVFGVQALGEQIKKEFGTKLKVKFIDTPNPI